MPKKKPKIKLLMLQFFFETKQVNGSWVHRVELTKELSESDLEVHAITFGDLNIGKKTICHKTNTKNLFFGLLKFKILYLKLLFTEKFDIAYTRNPLFGILGLILRFIKGTKTIYEINGIYSDELQSEINTLKKTKSRLRRIFGIFYRELLKKIMGVIEHIVIHKCDHIIVVTSNLKKEVIKRYHKKGNDISIIENGANINLFKPLDKYKCKRKLGLDINKEFICFSGNLAPWQGIETFIMSGKWVFRTLPTVYYLILGDGLMRDSLEKSVKKNKLGEHVIFTGVVPYKKVPGYINSSEICVSPFTKERNSSSGLSALKIFEYAACSRPIISSNISGLEFIEEQRIGLLIKPGNPNELADSIIHLMKDVEKRKEMGENGRRFIESTHSWKIVAKRVNEIISIIC